MTFDDALEPIKAPIAKLLSVWALVTIPNIMTAFHSFPWDDLSNIAALAYTLLLIIEFIINCPRGAMDSASDF